MLLEGAGVDWIVVRRSGRAPEIIHFKSLEEMIRGIQRFLSQEVTVPPLPPPRTVVHLPVIAQPLPVVALTPIPSDFDCRTCGACCAPTDQQSQTHVRLEGSDLTQLPGIMRQSLVSSDGKAILTKTLNGKTVCAALSGAIGGQCKCGIYKQRPMVCQVFEIGSIECLEARQRFGL